MFNFSFTNTLIRLPAIVLALSVHEFSHALSAYALGDPTAKNLGRLTLNPLKHLDPFGFVCLVLANFGWAKPVPINQYNFRSVDANTGIVLTALAGPVSNIIFCFISVGLLFIIPARLLYSSAALYMFLQVLIIINASLAFFNLLPVPPLDGSKILFGMLPGRYYYLSRYLDRYGFIILMILIMTDALGMILGPLTSGLITLFYRFFSFIAT